MNLLSVGSPWGSPRFNSFLDELFRDVHPAYRGNSWARCSYEEGKALYEVAVPGVKKEDITLTLENGQLIVQAESKRNGFSGQYKQTFTLPKEANDSQIEASLEDGILRISIPLIERKGKPITIR